MAILRTRKISFYVYEKVINEFLEFLQESGIMEPDMKNASVPERFLRSIEECVKNAEQSIAIMNRYEPIKKKMFSKHREISSEEYKTDKKHMRKSAEIIREVLRLEKNIAENKAVIADAEKEINELLPYSELCIAPTVHETVYCRAVCGKCSCSRPYELFGNLPVCCDVISQRGSETYIFLMYLKRDETAVGEVLTQIGFSQMNMTANESPKERIKKLENNITACMLAVEECENKIKKLAKNRHMAELYYDKMLLKRERYKVFLSCGNTDKVFVVTGFVPDDETDKLIQLAEKRFGTAAEYEELSDSEHAPVDFVNNAFVSPVEEITSSYAMPSENDIDPNPIMAVFYYWFFGMMFSDAGYGILIMIVCAAAGFFSLAEGELQKRMRMFFWCGVSTTLWGIAYGSFFGDLIKTVSDVFGGGNAEFKPVLIDPINNALELLIISVAFGAVHILTAMIIRFYNLWRKGDKYEAVYDVGFWIVFIVAAALFAAGVGTGNNGIKTFGLILAVVSLAGIVLTGGREKKNPILRIIFGVLSLYDITSYVGDFLSYSRLMALGLATGVIASVVNVLASLAGNSVIGAVLFVLIASVGHALNFSINMLGAYVHTNRLQYVEFYQKFYEGGGRKFKPFGMNTKYYNFTRNRG